MAMLTMYIDFLCLIAETDRRTYFPSTARLIYIQTRTTRNIVLIHSREQEAVLPYTTSYPEQQHKRATYNLSSDVRHRAIGRDSCFC